MRPNARYPQYLTSQGPTSKQDMVNIVLGKGSHTRREASKSDCPDQKRASVYLSIERYVYSRKRRREA